MNDLIGLTSFIGSMGLWITIGSFVFAGLVMFFVLRYMRKVSGGDLRTRGIPAEATILQVSDTGQTMNDNPVAQLLLQVEAPGQLPYQVSTRSLIPRLQVGMLQPGARVRVKIDPANQQRVALDLY
ncbi:MAG: hypothetical protein MUD01_13170 [Chloroflexaceae bacterium]|jgi:hypothetical protein|nr:hypothetical protein [Chloroflexaceae bacterium]